MGAHLLLVQSAGLRPYGRHLRLPRHSRICKLCHSGALGNERHMLLECSALSDLRAQFSTLISECSGVMASLTGLLRMLLAPRLQIQGTDV